MKEQFDVIKKPQHYQFLKGCFEVRDVIADRLKIMHFNGYSLDLAYDYANAIKYLLRWPIKNGLEDLKKSRECLNQMIEYIETQKTE